MFEDEVFLSVMRENALTERLQQSANEQIDKFDDAIEMCLSRDDFHSAENMKRISNEWRSILRSLI